MKRILIVMAMQVEAIPIINRLGLKKMPVNIKLNSCFPRYKGEFNNKEIIISLNGTSKKFGVDRVGTEYAALNTQSAIIELFPDLIINAGTCGAFSADAEIADIIITDQPVMYHDHRGAPSRYAEFACGYYPVLYKENYFKGLEYKLGVVTTGSSVDMSEIDEQMIRENNGMAKEMECASVAAVADLYKIDFFPVKVVADFIDIDVDNAVQFNKNLDKARKNLAEAVMKILRNIK